MFEAMETACNTIVTQWHWLTCAILCSLLTRVQFPTASDDAVLAAQWLTPKPYPPSVSTVVQGLSLDRAQGWHDGLEKSMLLLHDWAWSDTNLLGKESRATIRAMKAIWDLRLLVHAAILTKRKTDPVLMDQLDGEV